MRMLRYLAMAALVVIGGASCSEDDMLQGDWDATTFTYAKTGSAPVDVLAAGGSIHLLVAGDLSIGGSMKIPASVTGGEAVQVGLLGESYVQGNIVTLTPVTPTFISETEWHWSGDTMTGTKTTGGVTYVVTLTKQ
jgi:hypothetical protein